MLPYSKPTQASFRLNDDALFQDLKAALICLILTFRGFWMLFCPHFY
jgi:hypothetical protein